MTVIIPWHSPKGDVHHNNTECRVGYQIEREDLRHGTGGRPLCKECEKHVVPQRL
jgi:hypothetical protein